MTSTIYDARNFYFDLTAELRRLRSPRYPQREWHRALERADNADQARAVMARNGSDDAGYFDHQHSYQMLESDATMTLGSWDVHTAPAGSPPAGSPPAAPLGPKQSLARDCSKAAHSDPAFYP